MPMYREVGARAACILTHRSPIGRQEDKQLTEIGPELARDAGLDLKGQEDLH